MNTDPKGKTDIHVKEKRRRRVRDRESRLPELRKIQDRRRSETDGKEYAARPEDSLQNIQEAPGPGGGQAL